MAIQDWFCFDNSSGAVANLPQPYNTLSSVRLNNIKSQYTTQDTAARNINHCTLSYPPIQAIHEIILTKVNVANALPFVNGIGKNNQFAFAQFKKEDDSDLPFAEKIYYIAAYSFTNGLVMVGKYDTLADTYEQVDTANLDKFACTAIFMALHYAAMTDTEYNNCFNSIESSLDSSTGFDNNHQTEMGILCDNLYRRLKKQGESYSILTNGTVQPLTRTQISAGRFVPTEQIGDVSILQDNYNGNNTSTTTASAPTDNSDFVGKYKNPNRILTDEEIALVPEVKSHIVIPKFVKTVCEHIQLSFDKPIKMGNAMFRGIAGTGKTTAAKLVAAGLSLPYGNVTCSADTQIFDLLGSIIPDTSMSVGNPALDAEREKYAAMGGINYDTVSREMNFPDVQTIAFDPVTAYQLITGAEKASATAEECMKLIMQNVIGKVQELCSSSNGQVSYKYVETPLVKAIKNGWVCEIQEPTVIIQQGVLVGLNSLLEQDGNIVLPTGEVIKRHPDAVIIITTNTSYEGCRAMNQSVTDRMNLIFDIPNPTVDRMKQIAMSATGCTDETMVRKMAECVLDIEAYCKNKYITDGSVGMRGLIDWVNSYMITTDPVKSAELTVLSKATTDEDDRDGIRTACLNTKF